MMFVFGIIDIFMLGEFNGGENVVGMGMIDVGGIVGLIGGI